MRIKNLRPSPGVVIGTIALVFALTGAAVAATKINTNDIAKRAVTGSRIAPDSIKGGKILNGKVKAQDLAEGVIPTVPEQAYGRVNKVGPTVAPVAGAVGITGTAAGGPGVICYDLAFTPVSGTASVVGGPAGPGSSVEVVVGAGAGCAAPYTDAATTTRTSTAPADPADEDVYVDFVG
jgi:hypothetical protein